MNEENKAKLMEMVEFLEDMFDVEIRRLDIKGKMVYLYDENNNVLLEFSKEEFKGE